MKLFLNEDNDHYFKLGDGYLREAAMRRYIDGYAGMGADTISFCVMGQRANYASKYMDSVWDPLPDGSLPAQDWCVRLKRLHDAGLDPYSVWIDECFRKHISPWISFRMNDVHHVHPGLAFRADRSWSRHFEWTRRPECFPAPSGRDWQYYQDLQESGAWNYAVPEVREKMLGLMSEAAERYDVPCYELDFCRSPFCLSPGREQEEAPLLNGMIRAFRRVLDQLEMRRRHPHSIAVRVPYDPGVASAWGLDVAAWCREKLITTLVAAPFWRSFVYSVPLEKWRTITGENVRVIPCVDQWVAAGPEAPIANTTLPFLFGWCDCMDQLGADAVYLFNLPYFNDPAHIEEAAARDFQAWFREKFSLKRMRQSHCRYQAGYLDFVRPGEICTGRFPASWKAGEKQEFRYPAVSIPLHGSVKITPCFEEDLSGICHIQLNGALPGKDGCFPVEALCAAGNRITLTPSRDVRLMNLYLDVFPET